MQYRIIMYQKFATFAGRSQGRSQGNGRGSMYVLEAYPYSITTFGGLCCMFQLWAVSESS